MIIELKNGQSSSVLSRLSDHDLEIYNIQNNGKHFIVTSGDERQVDFKSIKSLSSVRNLINGVENPYYFASNDFKSNKTIVNVGNVAIGGKEIIIMAGPCAVENMEDTLQTARLVKKAGTHIFRGGAFKPRTTPHNFQGTKEKGLEILAHAKKETGLPIITEVMRETDIDLVSSYADILQIGSRNMTNSALLKSLGKAKKPILLKRSFSSGVKEFLKAAEFIIVNGNPNVILCERGIMTFETYTRFTLDISAIVAIRELSHLPVIVDPSHATGKPSFIPAMSKAAIAAGADGLLIEVHVCPEKMIKPGDGFQALVPAQLKKLVEDIKPFALAAGRQMSSTTNRGLEKADYSA